MNHSRRRFQREIGNMNENMKSNEIDDEKFKSYFIISLAQRISNQLDKSHFQYLKRELVWSLDEFHLRMRWKFFIRLLILLDLRMLHLDIETKI